MLKKIIVMLLSITLMIGALGIVGCTNDNTKEIDTKKESSENKDKEEVSGENDGLAIPALFDDVGYEVYEGNIVEGFDYRDDPTLGDVIIETDGTVKEVADHAKKKLKKINATILDNEDSEEKEDRIRISAIFTGKDGTPYSFNIKIAAGQDTEKIWVGYTIQTVKVE